MTILAIDPGTEKSGWCLLTDDGKVVSGEMDNRQMVRHVMNHWQSAGFVQGSGRLAIEMVASYGMAVGKETFRTVWWAGRFAQAWYRPDDVLEIYRSDVKSHLCHSQKARDANIRQALIDMFGPGKDKAVGNKAKPGPLYGVKSHAWAALAVAVTAQELIKLRELKVEAMIAITKELIAESA